MCIVNVCEMTQTGNVIAFQFTGLIVYQHCASLLISFCYRLQLYQAVTLKVINNYNNSNQKKSVAPAVDNLFATMYTLIQYSI